ncbi:DNA polymerase III subunit beta [bacterium]|nr:DNA polymerase III subunit beta [bacterium]
MKLMVVQKQLGLAVKAINKCLNRRPHLPVLSGIHLIARDGQLVLMTTDLTAGLRIKIEAEITEDGEVTVSGKNFVEAVGFFDGEKTEMDFVAGSEDKEMMMKNGRDKVKIPVMNDDFPAFAMTEGLNGVKKEVSFWKELVARVAFAASNDQSRPALTGILLKKDSEGTHIVCTDGFRLAIWQTKEQVSDNEELNIIVSAKAITDVVAIAEILEEKAVSLIHDEVGEQIWLEGERMTYFSKLINATYPPFEKIVPLDFSTEVSLNREEWLKNLSKASVFTKVDSNTVKMNIGDEVVEFSAVSLGDGSFQGQQEIAKKSGENLEISFNIKYLQDFLNTQECETIWLGCNGPLSPVMIKDPAQTEMIYIAMPFKPKN